MRKVYIILLVVISIATGCSNSGSNEGADKYYVILMGGQSNMVGQGRPSEIKREIPGNVQFFNLRTPDYAPHPKRFGPEVGVWKILGKEFPDKNFIMIKYAIGGSSMLDWSPNYDKDKARITGHPEYGSMYESLLQKTDSITRIYNSEFLALMWMQGGRDAKVPEASKEYNKNFRSFIHAIRERLSSENLPIIYGLSTPDINKFPDLPVIQAAQRSIDQEIDKTYMIDLSGDSDLAKWEDKIHYSTQGQLDLGEKFGNKLLEINKELSLLER